MPRTRTTWTKQTPPKMAGKGRAKGIKETRPRMVLSKASIREAFELIAKYHPSLYPRVILDALQRLKTADQRRLALGYMQMAARLLDAPPDRNVNLNANLHSEVDINVTQAQIGLLTDAELHQFASMLERVGVKPGELTMDDGKPALPALVGDGKKGN